MTRSPGRLKEQVQETVREIPVQAARLALSGVGRTLLLTDRVRKDYHEARESGLRPVLERYRGDAERIAGKVVGTVTERVSGSGRHAASAPTTTAEPKETPETPVARPPARKVNESLAAEPAKPADANQPAPRPGGTKATADSLPVPDYDTSTLASVRARLRSLTAAQVSQLRDYEQAHAARPDFLRMFENRIAKLTSGS